MNNRKVPLRKCVVTGEMKPKKELVRIVRTKEGEVSIDLTGKKNGRGAYLTLDEQCIIQAKKKNILATQLKASLEDELYEELIQLAKKEKQ
ncbi:RNase P modulator RnpM [Metabacillus fastidiosus]|uniref:YlxR family protein n=1 Tax=Metabacillus fastidiosus TaxID=1458 RepID=A0ABU6NYP4_9BACI|nr:YlxR family protein [Metabacillus fastidiosus]MEC2076940.1 YlxR family protein [Metabacillus fastidiosus]MED4401492.1 YlxR family protein [Metabacillus fastidiosus]MED4452939.1 YlxR family protein [Metabacillus fastidiosus]MED4463126.1 YlxR family protein [Metabacillus fastidiosus]MED4532477.1 YlxR family protein [Metabacillus fastidiosus]